MKFVIQRVNHASVTVDGQTVGSIGKGLLILFGAGKGDTEEMLPSLWIKSQSCGFSLMKMTKSIFPFWT